MNTALLTKLERRLLAVELQLDHEHHPQAIEALEREANVIHERLDALYRADEL